MVGIVQLENVPASRDDGERKPKHLRQDGNLGTRSNDISSSRPSERHGQPAAQGPTINSARNIEFAKEAFALAPMKYEMSIDKFANQNG